LFEGLSHNLLPILMLDWEKPFVFRSSARRNRGHTESLRLFVWSINLMGLSTGHIVPAGFSCLIRLLRCSRFFKIIWRGHSRWVNTVFVLPDPSRTSFCRLTLWCNAIDCDFRLVH